MSIRARLRHLPAVAWLLALSLLVACDGDRGAREELARTRAELESTRHEIESTRGELESTRGELKDTRRELELTSKVLESTSKALEGTRDELELTRGVFEGTRDELKDALAELEYTPASDDPAVMRDALLASEELLAIRSPDRTESFAVEDVTESPDREAIRMDAGLPGDFRILPGAVPVAPDLAAELSQLLLAPSSYESIYPFCGFQPGIALRFWRGTSAVDVLMCFHCDQLAFVPVGGRALLGGAEFFLPARGELVRLLQKARPDDANLADLR